MLPVFQSAIAEFPAGVLLVAIVIGIPVYLCARQLKIRRRNAKKEKGEVSEW